MYGKCIVKYNPPVRNHHNKIAYCMVKGDHVYTLNHDLKSLQQKQDDVKQVIVKASSDYRVNEDKKPTEYKMIESINDVLTMIEEAKDDKRVIVNLILKGDDLAGLLYEFKGTLRI